MAGLVLISCLWSSSIRLLSIKDAIGRGRAVVTIVDVAFGLAPQVVVITVVVGVDDAVHHVVSILVLDISGESLIRLTGVAIVVFCWNRIVSSPLNVRVETSPVLGAGKCTVSSPSSAVL